MSISLLGRTGISDMHQITDLGILLNGDVTEGDRGSRRAPLRHFTANSSIITNFPPYTKRPSPERKGVLCMESAFLLKGV